MDPLNMDGRKMSRILYHLKGHPYVRGDALHEDPLLLEGILQAHLRGLRVPTRHPVQGGH